MPLDRTAAINQRNRIAQTMMNIGRPPPQVATSGDGMPPGFQMAPTQLKYLMGVPPGMSPGFMGGEPTPMPGMAPAAPPAAAPPPAAAAPPAAPPQPPADPASLFAKPPVPGQLPPQFAKPPVF